MHYWAASVQVASEQSSCRERLGPSPLHQALDVLRLEFLGRSAARQISQRGHACLAPVGMRNAHCAHVQAHLDGHILSKDTRVQQQQCLRPIAFAPVAATLDDVLQLGAAIVIELKGVVSENGK